MKIKFYFLLFILLCSQSLLAQKKDTLRWFIGHWKDKKTFIIDSNMTGGASGGTIVIKGNGSIETTTPENKKFDNNLNEQITQIEKEEKDIEQKIRQDQGMYQYNFATECKEELEQVKNEFKGYVANPQEKKEPPPTPEQQLASKVKQACIDQEADYHRLIDFTKNKANKKGPFNLPPPPGADYFNCWGCDSARQAQFDTLSEHYANTFFKEEAEKVSELLGWMRQLELMGHGEANKNGFGEAAIDDLFHSSKSHPEKNGACSYFNYFEMNDAVNFYVQRGLAKAEQLFKENKKNYGALKPVVMVYLGALRQAMLLGIIPEHGDESVLRDIGSSIRDLYDKLTDRLLHQRDYSLIGSIPFILGIARQAILLGVNEKDIDDLDKLIGFTHFKLTLELDAKLGKNGGYIIAHLKGTTNVVTELDKKEKQQCVKFVLANKEENNIKMDVIANEIVAPSPRPTYIGTKIYTSAMPQFKIHFCPAEADTFFISRFQPKAPDKGLWNIPQAPPAPLGINGMDGFFTNGRETANEAQEINAGTDEAQLEDMKMKAQQLAAQMQGADPKKMAELSKQMMNMGNQAMQMNVAKLAMLKFPVAITNMNKVLVNQRFELKEMNPDAAPSVVYGYFTIKLEHDPKNGDKDQ